VAPQSNVNIIHLCRQYHPSIGGVERFVAELVARTAARGHTVEVATLNRLWHSREALPAHDMLNGISVHRFPFVGGALFFVAPGVLRLLSRFDLLHVHNTDFFLDYVALTRFIHRRPFVVSTHGGFFHTADYSALKRIYFALVTRHSLRAASVVIPNSAGDERRFAPYARKAVRIDNAIDYAAFAGVNRQPVPGRIITVGRFAPNKDGAALLRVFAVAHEARPDLSLVVVGEGPLRAGLEAQAADLGIGEAALWLGKASDERLRAELGQAEVFVSAARYEGFGLAMLEAMAAGVIPVVNDIEAFRDVIVEGENGFLTDYEDVGGAADALLAVLGRPPDVKQMVSAAAKGTAAQFDWEKAVMKFEEVYVQACQIGGALT
jgi:alpha-1,3-mannosyltransferase